MQSTHLNIQYIVLTFICERVSCYEECTKHLNKEYNKLIWPRNNESGTVVDSIVDNDLEIYLQPFLPSRLVSLGTKIQ